MPTIIAIDEVTLGIDDLKAFVLRQLFGMINEQTKEFNSFVVMCAYPKQTARELDSAPIEALLPVRSSNHKLLPPTGDHRNENWFTQHFVKEHQNSPIVAIASTPEIEGDMMVRTLREILGNNNQPCNITPYASGMRMDILAKRVADRCKSLKALPLAR